MRPDELSSAVRADFAYAARYIAPFLRAESANEALKRPDVYAELEQAIEQARQTAEDAVREAWAEAGGPLHEYLKWLVADVNAAFRVLGKARAMLRAEGTAGLMKVGEHCALRARLALHVAETAARSFKALAEGRNQELAGSTVYKVWVSKKDPSVCHWCRALDGTVVPLHASFPKGSPADLTGHGRLTRPPKVYRGKLLGPPRHPRCRCRIRITTNLPGHPVASLSGSQDPDLTPLRPGFLAASDIRAMDSDRYQAVVAFFKASRDTLSETLARLSRY